MPGQGLPAIRTALQGLAEGLQVGGNNIQIYKYPPDAVNVPCGILEFDDPAVVYATSEGIGMETWRFRLLVLVGRVDAEGGAEQLDELIDPAGVKAHVEDGYNEISGTMGDTVTSVWVDKAGSVGQYPIGDVAYLGARFFISAQADSGVH